MDHMELKEKLPMLIRKRGLKQADVARITGIPAARFTDWKDPASGRTPTLEQALRVARALGVPLDYLADPEQDDPPAPALSDAEREIIAFVRRIGVETAWSRLGLIPGTVARPVGGTDLDPSERQPERQDERAKRPRRPR
jgi:transcriptional regulator with XRE-family HTH domain